LSVWIFAEQKKEQLASISLELSGIGRQLADELEVDLAALLVGSGVEPLARELIFRGADKVYLVEDPALRRYQASTYQKVIEDLIVRYNPEIVLFGATTIGRALAPRLACALDTGLSAHCVDLKVDKSKRQLVQVCPFFDHMVTIVCDSRPQMATIQLGVMPTLPRDDSRKGEIIRVDPEIGPPDVEILSVEPVKQEASGIEEAEVIVAVGRGVKDFPLLQELARLLGAVVGATMPVVDAGILPESYMIGQTGKIVKPKLYIGCGISGAGQHIVGMQNSEVIVAINKDETAPIFEVADYGIVGDLHKIVPALIAALKASQA